EIPRSPPRRRAPGRPHPSPVQRLTAQRGSQARPSWPWGPLPPPPPGPAPLPFVWPAERVTSLGKDWHRPCLKCEKCGKTLTSGAHAEHEGKPYCNHPCYAAMFGPKGFGRGGAESHTFK
uniref:Cysteine-rich protein 1 n=1 Tax=Equus asinus asinus TaxID=83772 RepID=A0A8C4L6V3_EQUAS